LQQKQNSKWKQGIPQTTFTTTSKRLQKLVFIPVCNASATQAISLS